MKILALDTSANVCTVALCENEKLISEITVNTGNTHSQTLLPAVEQVLKLTETEKDEIDVYACTLGPGSFTGVRIGVATVKGMAFGKGKPCVGVSALEALAYNLSSCNGIICPVMDARRDHVYNALFKCENGKVTRLCPDRLISVSELDTELSGMNKKIYLSGDGYDLCKRKFEMTDTEDENFKSLLNSAYSVARVAFDKYSHGEYVTDFELSPVYLRSSQAERERLEKEKNN